MRSRLRDPASRGAVRAELGHGWYGGIEWKWDRFAVSSVDPAIGDDDILGISIAEIADRRQSAPEDAFLDLCADHGAMIGVIVRPQPSQR